MEISKDGLILKHMGNKKQRYGQNNIKFSINYSVVELIRIL